MEVLTKGEAWSRWEKCEGKRGLDECPGVRGNGEEESSIHLVERENKPPLRSFPVLWLYDPGLQLRNQCQTLEASPTEMAGSDH